VLTLLFLCPCAAGGDEEAEAEARKVLAEAEVTCIVSDSKEASPVSHLDSTPKSFR
jgi:hypothetical protein